MKGRKKHASHSIRSDNRHHKPEVIFFLSCVRECVCVCALYMCTKTMRDEGIDLQDDEG